MTPEALRQRAAELLLSEVKASNELRWFYISIAKPGQFLGGCYVSARGPTEAWHLMHRLEIFPKDSGADTETWEIPKNLEHMATPDKAWRLLAKEEL